MAFDIHQQVLDRDGMPLEKKARQYHDQLMQLFEQSLEGQALQQEGSDLGWASMMLEFGVDYFGVTPPKMSPHNLSEILFDLFPRKVSTSADEADDIVRTVQAFWKFMQREFHLANAAACLKVLDDRAARELKKKMSDPSSFGIAKSFVMMGKERGFDMTSEKGLNEWMALYNAEIAASTGLRIPLPGEQSESAKKFHSKLKGKKTRDSRLKNRRKK